LQLFLGLCFGFGGSLLCLNTVDLLT
jgi:hypothetical protein